MMQAYERLRAVGVSRENQKSWRKALNLFSTAGCAFFALRIVCPAVSDFGDRHSMAEACAVIGMFAAVWYSMVRVSSTNCVKKLACREQGVEVLFGSTSSVRLEGGQGIVDGQVELVRWASIRMVELRRSAEAGVFFAAFWLKNGRVLRFVNTSGVESLRESCFQDVCPVKSQSLLHYLLWQPFFQTGLVFVFVSSISWLLAEALRVAVAPGVGIAKVSLLVVLGILFICTGIAEALGRFGSGAGPLSFLYRIPWNPSHETMVTSMLLLGGVLVGFPLSGVIGQVVPSFRTALLLCTTLGIFVIDMRRVFPELRPREKSPGYITGEQPFSLQKILYRVLASLSILLFLVFAFERYMRY